MKASVQTFRLALVEDRTIKYDIPEAGSPLTAVAALREYLYECDCEHCAVLFMDGKNRPIGIHTVSIGTIDKVLVGVRDVFKAAILANASAIVVAHNHPSGDVNPSPEDVELTHKLSLIGAIMGIRVADCIIVNRDGWVYSFASENNLYGDEVLDANHQ